MIIEFQTADEGLGYSLSFANVFCRLGSFQRDPPQRKEKKPRNLQQADKDSKEVIKPKQVNIEHFKHS